MHSKSLDLSVFMQKKSFSVGRFSWTFATNRVTRHSMGGVIVPPRGYRSCLSLTCSVIEKRRAKTAPLAYGSLLCQNLASVNPKGLTLTAVGLQIRLYQYQYPNSFSDSFCLSGVSGRPLTIRIVSFCSSIEFCPRFCDAF